MNYRIALFSLTFFITTSLFSHIVEHSELSNIWQYINQTDYHQNTIVILDIDNTIATLGQPFQLLGGDAWVNYEITQLISQGMNPQDAVTHVLPLYYELTHIIDLRPVEQTTVEIIKQLQQAGITVVACTIRSLPISNRTIEQLHAIGINFAHSSFSDQELLCLDTPYHFKNGVIFCHGGDKGKIFKNVADYCDYQPVKVIVVDDKERYLHQIQKVLPTDVEFIGIRYSHLDEKVKQFDAIVAEEEKQAYLNNRPAVAL